MEDDTFCVYGDIGEKGFIRWSLGYTMEPIIECFQAIPQPRRYEPAMGGLSAPCWILGHLALNEEGLLKGFAQGVSARRCPFPRDLFGVPCSAGPEQLAAAIPDTTKLVDYWRAVREDTLAYLAGLTPAELGARATGSTLPDGDGNRDNPVREFFLMAIQHQNCHWGELRAICKILGVPIRW